MTVHTRPMEEEVMSKEESRTRQQAGRTKDARGRCVTQLDPVMLHLLHRLSLPSNRRRLINSQQHKVTMVAAQHQTGHSWLVVYLLLAW